MLSKLESLYWKIYHRIIELPLLFKGKVSFKYWLKHSTLMSIWVYTDENISIDNENCYGYDFGMKLIGENVFKIDDGSVIHNPEHKGIYLKQDNEFIMCKIENNKLIPIQKEQITLDLPKTQIIRLRNKAKEKNLSLKDYLLQQINSIL